METLSYFRAFLLRSGRIFPHIPSNCNTPNPPPQPISFPPLPGWGCFVISCNSSTCAELFYKVRLIPLFSYLRLFCARNSYPQSNSPSYVSFIQLKQVKMMRNISRTTLTTSLIQERNTKILNEVSEVIFENKCCCSNKLPLN